MGHNFKNEKLKFIKVSSTFHVPSFKFQASNTMQIVKDKISVEELKGLARKMFGNLIKAVVDVEQKIMAIDGELHSDEERLLIENGSKQQDLWGINLYPDKSREEWIEFDSMINLRPSQGNRSRNVENPEIKDKIKQIVQSLIK